MFESADKDGDGVITQEEFSQWLFPHFLSAHFLSAHASHSDRIRGCGITFHPIAGTAHIDA